MNQALKVVVQNDKNFVGVNLLYMKDTSQCYVGHLESKERLRVQPAQLFNFS